MSIKINLTKKQLLKLTLFVAVIGVAVLLDSYIDNNPIELGSIDTSSNDQKSEQSSVYLINQLNVPGAKVEVQKPTFRKIQPKLHDRLIQKYHQVRNFQVLKAEVEPKTSSMISGYGYLAFKNYFYTNPDDDYLIVA